jgi:saccharopine dehydrogenase-like protein
LDHGIDHLLAHDLVGRARDAVGDQVAIARSWSCCGGLPAVLNEFRYRFSWAPLGVLKRAAFAGAVRGARCRAGGDPPWKSTRELRVGGETFEVYPNRDSMGYSGEYGLSPTWHMDHFVRGTLRLTGWSETRRKVFDELQRGDEARLAQMANELVRRYPMAPTNRDRVVLTVGLDLTVDDRTVWSGEHSLDLLGSTEDTAMAQCVTSTVSAQRTPSSAVTYHRVRTRRLRVWRVKTVARPPAFVAPCAHRSTQRRSRAMRATGAWLGTGAEHRVRSPDLPSLILTARSSHQGT